MKALLLAKANIRKTKGLTIGLSLLILIASCFLTVLLMIYTDFNQNAINTAERLNAEDVYLIGDYAPEVLNEKYIREHTDSNQLKDIEITSSIGLGVTLDYAGKPLDAGISLEKTSVFDNRIGKTEIVEEDTSIESNYIYLPYLFKTSVTTGKDGKSKSLEVGDSIDITVFEKGIGTYTVRGFYTNLTRGIVPGTFMIIASDDAYEDFLRKAEERFEGAFDNPEPNETIVKFKLAEDVDAMHFVNDLFNKMSKDYSFSSLIGGTQEQVIMQRTISGLIFSVILIIVCGIILLVVVLMLSNNISNFIRENIRTLGALKALGYTNANIRSAFLIQFVSITLIAGLAGVLLALPIMYLLGSIMVTMSGLPYTPRLNAVSGIVGAGVLFVIVLFFVLFFLRKTKKIQPIAALREGNQFNNMKKNRIPLATTSLPLNIALAMKATFVNLRQNIITFAITFFMIFMAAFSFVLLWNFGINPKLSLMTDEYSDAYLSASSDSVKEVREYLEKRNDITNIHATSSYSFQVNGDINLQTSIVDDVSKLNNQEQFYQGVAPKTKDEVALAGLFAEHYDYKIGDTITFKSDEKEVDFKITALTQSMNGSDRALMSQAAAARLVDTFADDTYMTLIDFDFVDKNVDRQKILDEISDHFGDKKVLLIKDFEEEAETMLASFKFICFAVVILVMTINGFVILLVLFMLVKTLVSKRKQEYGIFKGLGYSSIQIIMQNALSFMPTIILAVITSSIISALTINPVIGSIMRAFGVMQLNFYIPIEAIAIVSGCFVLVAFIISLIASRKIKKLEAYKLLIGD